MSLPARSVRRILAFLLIASLGGWGSLALAGAAGDAPSAWRAGDLRTATILLKDRLQRDPNDAAARVLLAQVYLDSANPGAARQELERALQLPGVDADATLVPMARAWLEQGQGAKLLAEPEPAPGLPAATRAELLALRGDALLAAQDPQNAGLAYGRALASVPDQPRALLGQARLAMSQGLPERTAEALAAALQANPTDAQTAVLAGDFAYLQGRPAEAEAHYTKALEQATNRWLVQYKRALARLELGQFAGAQQDIEAAAAGLPEFTGIHYARGLLAFRRGHYEPALADFELFLRAFPQDQSATYYAAAALYRLKRYAQAQEYLTVLRNGAPELVSAANLLAATRLELGKTADAQALLAPFAAADKASAETLRLYARALDTLGRGAEAQKALSRASSAAPQDDATRVALALSQLKTGNPSGAQAGLESLIASHPDAVKTRILLVRSLIDQGKAQAAVSAAEALAQRTPRSAQAHFVLGIAQHAAKDEPAARRSFAQALELEPGHPESAFALAALEIRAGRPDLARGLYEQVLRIQPENGEAVLKLAQLDVAQGQRAAAFERLNTALTKDPGNLALRLNLARGYLSAGLIPDAQRTLQGAAQSAAADPGLLWVRAQVDLAAGQPFNALPSLEALVRLQPVSADAHFLFATALAATKNLSGMQEQLHAGYQIDPKSALANEALTRVYDALPDARSKRDLLGRLKGRADASTIPLLEARLALDEGKYPEGLKLLGNLARTRPKDPAVFTALLNAQVQAGELDAATQTVQTWLKTHPDDVRAQERLAQVYLRQGHTDKALERYRDLVKAEPKNAIFNNNLAMLLLDTQATEALTYARAASAAAPEDPAVADTLGVALLAGSDARGAVQTLAKAHAALPTQASVAFHYARALAAAGDAAQARSVLLSTMEQSFPEKAQAQALLKQLAP